MEDSAGLQAGSRKVRSPKRTRSLRLQAAIVAGEFHKHTGWQMAERGAMAYGRRGIYETDRRNT